MKKLSTWLLALLLIASMPIGTIAEGLKVEYVDSAEATVRMSEEDAWDNAKDALMAVESALMDEEKTIVSDNYEELISEEGEIELSIDSLYDSSADTLEHSFSSDLEKKVMADSSYVINGHSVSATVVADPGDGQCWAYANSIYSIIWGTRFDSTFTGSSSSGYNLLRNLSDGDRTLTADHLKRYISQAELGSVIRIGGCTSGCSHWNDDGLSCGHSGHSLVLVSKSESGFTTFERLNGPGRREKSWTWDSFCSAYSSYPYIKYIKWPNANACSTEEYNAYPDQPVLSVSPCNNGYSTAFSWISTNNTSYYDIHIRDTNGNTILDDTTGKETSYQAQLPVGSYYAYVGAVNTNAVEWKATDSAHIRFSVVNHNAVPGKPELQITSTDNNHETVFSWKETTNTDHYDIHIMNSNDESVLDTCVDLNYSYSIRLKAGTYHAFVGAVNEYTDDISKWTNSDIVAFTISNANPRPSKPVLNVDAKDNTQDTVFTWTNTDNTTYYDVHIYNNEGILMSTDGVGKETIFRKKLPAGIYRAYIGAVILFSNRI